MHPEINCFVGMTLSSPVYQRVYFLCIVSFGIIKSLPPQSL